MRMPEGAEDAIEKEIPKKVITGNRVVYKDGQFYKEKKETTVDMR